MNNEKRSTFSGGLGFVLAAAGSAVGLGNIWRFPYLAAKYGGGIFLLFYILLVITFGFSLMIAENAIGRKTGKSGLCAFRELSKKWGFIGIIATLIPMIIQPYYNVIGGWVIEYAVKYVTGNHQLLAQDSFFTDMLASPQRLLIYQFIFSAITTFVILRGVQKGVEKFSTILMPVLIVLAIIVAVYSITLPGAMMGVKYFFVPDFSNFSIQGVLAAMGQMFYSLSLAMGIMIAYGSYLPKDSDLEKNVGRIEIFDTGIAILAGLMIVPAVYVFAGTDGMSAGPGLMFISLPKVFNQMGTVGTVVGIVFFIMVFFAAVSSSVSIMEAIVASIMDKFKLSRKKSAVLVTVYAVIFGIIVCLGYNVFYFELKLPSGAVGQILDIFDYLSNNILMPIVAILTCILIGWVAKPKTVIDEVTKNGEKFGRKYIYIAMVKVVAPALLIVLLLQALGVF